MKEDLDKSINEAFGMSVAELEGALNDMLKGLANYVRDVNLDPEVAALYQPGMIIREKTFVDASRRVGGMATTHRFAIFSNHMADLSEYEHGTNWGLCVSASESRFKVLDVYTYEGKTQITLLHLLNDERWRIFTNAEFDMPGLTVKDIRGQFEMHCAQEPIRELTTDEWLGRCSDPIGMDPKGWFYPLDPLPTEVLWRIGDTGFRRFMGNVMFVAKGSDDEGKWLEAVPDKVDSDGVFVWPYIDQQAGLSFRYLCPANVDGVNWVALERDKSILALFRAGALENAVWCPTGIDPHDFEELTFETDKAYEPDNEAVWKLRELVFIDPIRHPLFPDDIQAFLVKEGFHTEQVWLNLCDLRDNVIFGRLLNEPDQNLGVHEGDVLPLALGKDEEHGIWAAVPIDELER